MGKKYIIEMEDTMFRKTGESGAETYLWRAKGFNSLVFDRIGISKLTPYTEPDLEQVREEAYEKGWKEAEDHYEKGYNDGYDTGLSDAWKAARKIIHMPEGDLLNIFAECYSAVCTALQVILKYDASEVIEKIQAYEQGKKEFHVGDEFENENDKKFVVLKMNGKEIDRYIDSDGRTYNMNVKYKVMRKTGRHFPEIAAVLEKMREGQE